MSRLEAAIAVTRFGMGARRGEIADAISDPRGWLKAQIRAEAALIRPDGLLSTEQVFAARLQDAGGVGRFGLGMAPAVDQTPNAEQARALQQRIQRETREGLAREVEARARHGASTPDSFAERWARFWANHFTVAARNAQLVGLVGPYEREAIRPNVFGSFSTLLAGAVFHPAMLVYLDANRSIGPSTEAARRRGAGLNENLAREILELHTLGVGSGYTQTDIVEFARALTGWTVGGPQAARTAGAGMRPATRRSIAEQTMTPGRAAFLAPLHEPGTRTLLGSTYNDEGETQAARILDDLAVHPATARHLATKLVRHFVADAPPEAAVARIERTFTTTRGDLARAAAALIDLDEAWRTEARKFKTPDELLVSAARAAGEEAAFGRDVRIAYQSLAQRPFSAPAPSGWPDEASAWSGGDAMVKRLEWANAVARRLSRDLSPSGLLDVALGDLASIRTREAVARAETAEQGVTLALMSPEFQRR